MILVVGASGFVGSRVVEKLLREGQPVRILARASSKIEHLRGAEIAWGDLRDKQSLNAACRGARIVIVTANTIIPTGPYDFEAVEGRGYRDLIDACKRNGIEQFILLSVTSSNIDHTIPTTRYKRAAEEYLKQSGLVYSVFRSSVFMEVWLALIGSSIPLRGTVNSSFDRGFWFTNFFVRTFGRLIDNRGTALIPGPATRRHTFIAIDDVAAFLTKAIDHPAARNAIHEIGGPEILTWKDAVARYEKTLEKPIRMIHVPSWVYRLEQLLLRPFSPAASNLMGLSRLLSGVDTAIHMGETAAKFGIKLKSVEEFLGEKAGLPE